MSEGRLHLRVVTPARVVVDEEAEAVTLPAALGALGVLPGHTPLLGSLRIGELWYRQGAREHYMAIEGGFLEVGDDQVTVLAEVAELPTEIDVTAAEEARREAEAAMRTAAGAELDRQRARLEGALTRITVAGRR